MNSLAVLDARWHNHRVSGVYDTEFVATEVAVDAAADAVAADQPGAAEAAHEAAVAVASDQKRLPAIDSNQFGFWHAPV